MLSSVLGVFSTLVVLVTLIWAMYQQVYPLIKPFLWVLYVSVWTLSVVGLVLLYWAYYLASWPVRVVVFLLLYDGYPEWMATDASRTLVTATVVYTLWVLLQFTLP